MSYDGKFLTLSDGDEDDQGEFFQYTCFDHQADDVREFIMKCSDLREEQRMY